MLKIGYELEFYVFEPRKQGGSIINKFGERACLQKIQQNFTNPNNAEGGQNLQKHPQNTEEANFLPQVSEENLTPIPQDKLNELALLLQQFGELKRERGEGQLELASRVFGIENEVENPTRGGTTPPQSPNKIKNFLAKYLKPIKNNSKVEIGTKIQKEITFLKKEIINFCNENNLVYFFESLPNFVESNAQQLILKYYPSSLQFSFSDSEESKKEDKTDLQKYLTKACLMAVEQNIDILLPTPSCKKRIELCYDEKTSTDYKISVPAYICWGRQNNRTTAVRVCNNRVELRPPSTLANSADIINCVLSYYFQLKTVHLKNLHLKSPSISMQLTEPIFANAFNTTPLSPPILAA